MSKAPTRSGRFFTALLRILILTALFAAVGMGAGLFFGIVGALVYGAVNHTDVNMAVAYRRVAFPAAAVAAAGAFLYNVFVAIRRSVRQAHS